MRVVLLLAAVAASGMALAAGDEGLVPEDARNDWHFRIGPVMSPRVRVNVRGPRFALPLTPRPDLSTKGIGENPPAGREEGAVRRDYKDGYVYPDEGSSDGLTWNWGAKDVRGQYSDGRMEFRSGMTKWTENVESSDYSIGSGYEGDRDFLVGVEAMGGWTFFSDQAFDAAVDAGFRFYGTGDLSARSRYGTTVKTTHSEYRVVDSYDASGWTGEIPSGSHKGTSDGPGRIIGAVPERHDELIGESSYRRTDEFYSSGRTRLNYRIWDLRIGPTLGWQVTDYWSIRGGVYGLLGLVDATMRTSANALSGPRGARKSTCTGVFGMAFGISSQVKLTDSLFLYGGAEYDWWADSVDLNAGGASAEIKLSDLVVSLGLGVEF